MPGFLDGMCTGVNWVVGKVEKYLLVRRMGGVGVTGLDSGGTGEGFLEEGL